MLKCWQFFVTFEGIVFVIDNYVNLFPLILWAGILFLESLILEGLWLGVP
jgi:hypothetical protein